MSLSDNREHKPDKSQEQRTKRTTRANSTQNRQSPLLDIYTKSTVQRHKQPIPKIKQTITNFKNIPQITQNITENLPIAIEQQRNNEN